MAFPLWEDEVSRRLAKTDALSGTLWKLSNLSLKILFLTLGITVIPYLFRFEWEPIWAVLLDYAFKGSAFLYIISTAALAFVLKEKLMALLILIFGFLAPVYKFRKSKEVLGEWS